MKFRKRKEEVEPEPPFRTIFEWLTDDGAKPRPVWDPGTTYEFAQPGADDRALTPPMPPLAGDEPAPTAADGVEGVLFCQTLERIDGGADLPLPEPVVAAVAVPDVFEDRPGLFAGIAAELGLDPVTLRAVAPVLGDGEALVLVAAREGVEVDASDVPMEEMSDVDVPVGF